MNHPLHYPLPDLLKKAVKIAEGAGAIALSYYKEELTPQIKADGSRVTTADKACEAYIINDLSRYYPDIPIISEEAVAESKSQALQSDIFWLVDPIDGTEGFIKKNGDFAINIALVRDGKPILGVVHSPLLKQSFYGIEGSQAQVKLANGTYESLSCAYPDNGWVVLLYHLLPLCPARDCFLNSIQIKEKRMDSNILRFVRVAQGEVDVHPFFETCYEWDTAANHAILKSAGGNIITMDGQELTYGKSDYRNPHLIAHGQLSPFLNRNNINFSYHNV